MTFFDTDSPAEHMDQILMERLRQQQNRRENLKQPISDTTVKEKLPPKDIEHILFSSLICGGKIGGTAYKP